mgnify:CR=1 FL=1
MLSTIALVLVVLWVIGLMADMAGGIIHLLLVAAALLLAYDLMMGRRRTHLR